MKQQKRRINVTFPVQVLDDLDWLSPPRIGHLQPQTFSHAGAAAVYGNTTVVNLFTAETQRAQRLAIKISASSASRR